MGGTGCRMLRYEGLAGSFGIYIDLTHSEHGGSRNIWGTYRVLTGCIMGGIMYMEVKYESG